jgi:hypothetical protein
MNSQVLAIFDILQYFPNFALCAVATNTLSNIKHCFRSPDYSCKNILYGYISVSRVMTSDINEATTGHSKTLVMQQPALYDSSFCHSAAHNKILKESFINYFLSGRSSLSQTTMSQIRMHRGLVQVCLFTSTSSRCQ